MFGWTAKPRSGGFEPTFTAPTYRVQVRRHTATDPHDLHFYGGGDFSPYCIESLIDMLRGESHGVPGEYELTFEFVSGCSTRNLEEVARRLSTAGIAGLRGVVRGAGHRDVTLEAGSSRAVSRDRSATPSRSS
jgi:hypothetical protein